MSTKELGCEDKDQELENIVKWIETGMEDKTDSEILEVIDLICNE